VSTGRRLAWNSFLNILGHAAPFLVAFVAVPVLLRTLGAERFGILSLGWAVIGYFGYFDLGLGRALTRLVSERLASGDQASLDVLVWTALRLLFALGLCGWLVAYLLTPWLVRDALGISPSLRGEAMWAFYVLAASIPATVVTSGLRGVLEAYQRFDLVNAARVPLGILNYAGPLAVLPFTRSLALVLAVLLATRILGVVIHMALCFAVLPSLRRGVLGPSSAIGPLVRSGGWFTVSTVVSPLMGAMDRSFIGAIISAAAVGYYAAPYELVSKLLVIPGAVASALFPAFASRSNAESDRSAMLYDRGIKLICVALFPLILVLTTFSGEGLLLWLGPDVAAKSALVLQVLAIGVFCNGLAQVPFYLIQGAGRPAVAAKLHLVELPLYLALAWLLIQRYGIAGAALAWTIRAGADGAVLFYLARHVPGGLGSEPRPRLLAALVAAVGVLGLSATLSTYSVALRVAYLLVATSAFGATFWLFVVDPSERRALLQLRTLRAKRRVDRG
jgi:O-antigen/teichoic acid export membrane protein